MWPSFLYYHLNSGFVVFKDDNLREASVLGHGERNEVKVLNELVDFGLLIL